MTANSECEAGDGKVAQHDIGFAWRFHRQCAEERIGHQERRIAELEASDAKWREMMAEMHTASWEQAETIRRKDRVIARLQAEVKKHQ